MDIPDSLAIPSTFQRSQPQLPVEILDYILGFIADDDEDNEKETEDAFYAFSLASHSFRRAALPYTFRKLRVDIQPGAQSSMIDHFTRYLDHSIRRQFIQELQIHGVDSGDFPRLGLAEVDVVELVSLCQQLPKLRTVALYDVFLGDPNPEDTKPLRTFQGILPALDRFITTNKVRSSWTVDISLMLELLSCFAEVKRVCFDGIRSYVNNCSDTTPSFPPSMRSLKVWRCYRGAHELLSIVNYDIAERHVPISLQSLELDCADPWFHETADLLAHVGPNLLELSFDLGSLNWCSLIQIGRVKADVIEELRLSGCSRLVSFSLEWTLCTPGDSHERVATQVCTVLSFLHECPSIREVTLRVRIKPDADVQLAHEVFDAIAPRVQDELLKLKPLEMVKIELSYPSLLQHPPNSKEDFARSLFPNLKEKGLLHVTLK